MALTMHTAAERLTPLFWTHVARYGEVRLNMSKRVGLRGDTLPG